MPGNKILKPIVFLLGLVPLGWLVVHGFTSGLGADPVATITHHTGDWTLNFLLITLAITPVRRLTGWNRLAGYCRMVGLFAFFYACLHFATYLVFDHFFSWASIAEDVIKRRYITVGFSGFLLLIPLAITSTARMVSAAGGQALAGPPSPGLRGRRLRGPALPVVSQKRHPVPAHLCRHPDRATGFPRSA